MPQPALAPLSTPRFEKKRDAIIAAATTQINRYGVHGMTLTAVAADVGLITNSVTYYFKKKEDLAVAVYLEGIDCYRRHLAEALKEPDPPSRLRRYITMSLETSRKLWTGEHPPVPVFSDMRALPEPRRKIVNAAYLEMFAIACAMFEGAGYEWMGAQGRAVRAVLMLENVYWWAAWLHEYDAEDLVRVGERSFDIFANGIGKEGSAWAPAPLVLPETGERDKQDRAKETYLLAATKLVNRDGYRGVSVKNISAELNLTKGAFYHHHDTKNDVIVACFERTFEIMRAMQHVGVAQTANQWQALSSTAAALVDYQSSADGPLLRMSALSPLPEEMRATMVDHANRISMRFASMISDGAAEGSLRPVDPLIAAQMINAALNVSAELTFYLPGIDREKAAYMFGWPMLMGFFTPHKV
jgi:AcrR family transcriptional regulator